jgi:hypothetical protein
MGKSWLPLKDEPLRSFCTAFVATITPEPEAYALSAGDAGILDTLVKNYADALALNANPGTRTRTIMAAKQMAKVALIAGMRIVYTRMNAANLANDRREALGLPAIGAGHMRIAAAAAEKPGLAMPMPSRIDMRMSIAA